MAHALPTTLAILLVVAPAWGQTTGGGLEALSTDRLEERLRSELEFAERLTDLHADRRADWVPLLKQARVLAGEIRRERPQADDARKAEEVERVLRPIGEVAKTYTLHCVGHAHIDMNWKWSWPETVAVTNDTFTTVLRLMDEFPDFRFTQSQASVYEIVRLHNPALLDKIKARVKEGRWEVAASQWVEGDKNLASGEALAHHLLYTRQFMKEQFGLAPEEVPIDFEPDTFGHAQTIPTIVSRGGVTRYYMCRGGKEQKPPLFWWKGPDGSRILVNLETTWYNKSIGPDNAMAALRFAEKTGLRDWLNVYGVGDHGGGPTRRDILRAKEMDSWPIFPRFRFSTTREFFAIAEREADRLPVLDRELNFVFNGCYTSQSQIKRHNRFGEARAQDAEAAAVLALRTAGLPYPSESLRDAWTKVLFGHFHDILPGSGVRATREYQSGLFQQSAASLGTVLTTSLRAVAAAIDTSFAKAGLSPVAAGPDRGLGAGAGRGSEFGALPQAAHQVDGPRPFVVFNPLAFPREELVRATLWDTGAGTEGEARRRGFVVHTPDGQAIPAEVVGSGNYWGHGFVDVEFPASVGALGHSAYVIEERAAAANHPRTVKADANELVFENESLLVRFDRLTGGIRQLVSKATGVDVASPEEPLALLEFLLERPRNGSAWTIGDTMSRIHPLEVYSLVADTKNPYQATLVAKAKLRQSDLTVTYALKAGQSWLEVGIEANWLERGGADIGTPQLRMRFPTRLEGAKARYEIPYGTIVRDLNNGEEVPALRFADLLGTVRGEPAGLLVLNDSKHGHSLDRSTLAVTLIRSSYDPDPLPEIGAHSIRLALAPHGKALTVADMTRLGAAFNHPLQVVSTDLHAGRLAAMGSAVKGVLPGGVVVTAIKKADADSALVLRLLETEGKACAARVELDQSVLGRLVAAEEVDLLERPAAGGTARVSGQSVTVDMKPHGIASVRVTLE